MAKLSNDAPSSDSDDRPIEAAKRQTIEDESRSRSPEGETTETVRPKPTARIPERIGHYHIKRMLASGGMGTVYEATQQKPRRTVAVKVMKQGIASRSALRSSESCSMTVPPSCSASTMVTARR